MQDITREFQGVWITSEEFAGLKPVNVFHRQLEKVELNSVGPQNAHILFRSSFQAETGKQAIIYISADDYYKLYLNGRFVCQGPAPGYPFHYYYNKVDITDYLREGENIIAVHSYYQGLINRVWVSGDDRHGLILDVEQDGKVILSSDESFLYTYHSGFEAMGKAGYDTQFLERYVSGSAEEGFEQPLYDDSSWEKAKVRETVDVTLVEQPSKILVFEEIRPELIWDEGGVTADFGSIYVGYLCAEACGIAGEAIEILYGQELNEDGSVRWQMRCNCNYREEWILSGGADRLNQFDYKAFRYVRMNLPKDCTIEQICLRARHYPFTLTAVPAHSEPELEDIWKLCVHSMKYGVQEVIQDCMDREKGNYLGDGCYTALNHYVLTGDPTMLKKLLDDSLRSSFVNQGLMTCAACSLMQEIAEYPLMMYHMLLRYYEFSKDLEYLAGHYAQLCEVLDFYREHYALENGLLCNLDKWCVVEWPENYRDGYAAEIREGKVCTDLHSVINAHYIGALRCMNEIAVLTGHEKYCDEKPVTEAYFEVFYDREKKLFKDNADSDHISMISNVFPLMYGIYPEEGTQDRILELVEEKGFTTVMLFGAYPILEGLRRIGRKDKIKEYLKDEGAWKRMLREGATTTFEGWGKDSKWNTSLFHLTLTYATLFMV